MLSNDFEKLTWENQALSKENDELKFENNQLKDKALKDSESNTYCEVKELQQEVDELSGNLSKFVSSFEKLKKILKY